MAKKKSEEGMRTYLVEYANGTKERITVPDTWKVTYGPIAIGKAAYDGRPGGRTTPLALRFYEGGEKQRATFTDVINFRDMSIGIEVEKVTRQDKVGRMEVDGQVRNVNMQAEVREWVNPDVQGNSQEDLKLLHEGAEPGFKDMGKQADKINPIHEFTEGE